MKDKIIFMALLLAALLPGILAVAVPSAQAAPAAAVAQAASSMHHFGKASADSQRRTCDERYAYSDGVKGLANIPYARARWTHNTCTWYLQTRVKYDTDCRSALSGAVKAINLNAEADGVAGKPFCSAWIRFHAGGEPWGSWHKMG